MTLVDHNGTQLNRMSAYNKILNAEVSFSLERIWSLARERRSALSFNFSTRGSNTCGKEFILENAGRVITWLGANKLIESSSCTIDRLEVTI